MTADRRRILFAQSLAGPAGDGFAGAPGARLVQVDRLSLLRYADVDWADLERIAAAEHPGYRLEAYVERLPDGLVESYARAKTAMNDAPRDDAELGDWVITPETVRADEATAARLGQARRVVAMHEQTGEVAAFTEVQVTREAYRSEQDDTAVVPAHRGSRLGLWVKAEMLLRLRAERPDVAELLTGNAASNEHMLAINERLGYRLWSTVHCWQAEVPGLVRRLERAGGRTKSG